ncbi:MCE family protein [Nocardioides limicola]|uniref:MCE family protein n=1 Tax=Nocardioides limicola TaxID=2803368 RepID=UPI001EEF952F|nr:MCE family protein [Nocardioides sp. DJM-14]
METFKKLLVPGVLLVLVVTAGILILGGSKSKTVTASFPRTVSVYEGSDVAVLGVAIGTVEKVVPSGTTVEVTMRYDADVQIPADAEAIIVAPSIVGDRYVQLIPPYTGGDVLPDGAVLDTSRTGTPLELDEIYQSLDHLVVALGPDGANRDGSLTRLLETTAANFEGEGEKFNQMLHDLGTFSGTLDNNKDELFGAASELHQFIATLAENDQTVRDFNTSLAQVSAMLAGERDELSQALRNLSVAMRHVTDFVAENRELLGKNIDGINKIARILVKQRDALDETLHVAPLALTNLAHTYNPMTGTLDTRANVGNLVHEITSNPGIFLCGLVNQADTSGAACDLLQQILPRDGSFGEYRWEPEQPFDLTLGGFVEGN